MQFFRYRHGIALFLFQTIALTCHPTDVLAKKWTDMDGKTFEAEYVRFTEREQRVMLRRGNRVFSLQLSQLSTADRRYVLSTAVRTWTDRTGRYKTRAKLVKAVTDSVTIEKEDGAQVDVPLRALSQECQKFVADFKSLKVQPPSQLSLLQLFKQLDAKEKAAIPPSVQELIDIVGDAENKARITRLDAIRDIGKFGPMAAPALPFLRSLLLDNDLETRERVFEALANIGKPSVPTLVGILDVMKSPKHFAQDRKTAGPTLFRSLTRLSIDSLGKIPDAVEDATPILLELSIESDEVFAKGLQGAPDATVYHTVALETLEKLKPDPASIAPGLGRVLEVYCTRIRRLDGNARPGRFGRNPVAAKTTELVSQCGRAARMIAQMPCPPRELVPALISVLGTPQLRLPQHVPARVSGPVDHAIHALGTIGPGAKDALDVLRTFLDDKRLGKAAEDAISRISASNP